MYVYQAVLERNAQKTARTTKRRDQVALLRTRVPLEQAQLMVMADLLGRMRPYQGHQAESLQIHRQVKVAVKILETERLWFNRLSLASRVDSLLRVQETRRLVVRIARYL